MCNKYNKTSWAYGKEKIRGAERNLPDFFGLCPRCQRKFSGETFQNCCRRGGGGRSDYEKFLLDSIFPTKLTEFPTKLTELVPFIFIISQYCPTVKRILPDWLCLPNKLGGGGGGGGAAAPPRPPARYAHAKHGCSYKVVLIFCIFKNSIVQRSNINSAINIACKFKCYNISKFKLGLSECNGLYFLFSLR